MKLLYIIVSMLKQAMLYNKLSDSKVGCYLCAHRCKIAKGSFGVCGLRQNKEGELFTHVYGDVVACNIDPIEKKPLYHFLPGTDSYSIAALGCNFKCGFCQNWQISQANVKNFESHGSFKLTPKQIVEAAKDNNCKSIAYTYTEPTIFFEYAYDIAKLARANNIYNIFVTNGFMTKEALETIRPYLDAANVDLKFFNDETYKKICKGRLQPVLDSIRHMKKLAIWVEVTTLIVPGLNDSDKELEEIANFIAAIDKDMPWHLSRFHPDYQFNRAQPTPIETLKRAEKIGRDAGLKYVYLGNVGGENINTACDKCKELLIIRAGYFIEKNSITDGKCPKCKNVINGIWR